LPGLTRIQEYGFRRKWVVSGTDLFYCAGGEASVQNVCIRAGLPVCVPSEVEKELAVDSKVLLIRQAE
jgi:hypothetical protein